MTKAVLSNRIYLNCDRGSELDKELVKNLTYEISQEPISPYPLIISNITRISDTVVSIPAGRLDYIPEDFTIVDKQVCPEVVIPEPGFVPRESQQQAIDTFDINGLVEAPVS